jgi:hypothetical protein
VTVRTGRKSQTVNICTPRQVVGDYDAIYRLPIQSAIQDPGEIPEVATLAEFATWLTARNGVSEGTVVRQLTARPVVCLHWSALPSTTPG